MAPATFLMFLIFVMTLTPQKTSATERFFKLIEHDYVLGDCESPFEAPSVLYCASLCGVSGRSCIGWNFSPFETDIGRNERSGNCQLCLATKSLSLVTPDPPRQKGFLGYSNAGIQTSAIGNNAFVDLNPGLYDGQVITFKVIPGGPNMAFKFLTGMWWSNTSPSSNPDLNYFVVIYFPGSIIMDNFRNGAWQVRLVSHNTNGYFQVGRESEMVIFVTEMNYYTFVDGKAMDPYPRPTHTPLSDIQHPEVAAGIDAFLDKLKNLKKMEQPFTLKIDDPSGNSFLENPLAPSRDPAMIIGHFARTRDQDHKLGIYTSEELQTEEEKTGAAPVQGIVGQDDGKGFNTQNEVLSFATDCSSCGEPCETNMKLIDIPHFKEVVIMATLCEKCGRRDNEVKSSGGIESMGVRHELRIEGSVDMARDLLKSETAMVKIPELEFDMEMGTLGGKFTTVEGILVDIQKQLKDLNPFFHGDSSQPETNNRLSVFCTSLDEIAKGERTGVTLVLEDPAGNSYIQSLCTPDPDPQLKVTKYERTFEENEDLGLNQMQTEDYTAS